MVVASKTGESMPVPGRCQRVLLATLLLSANVPVSRDALAEAVWDGSPPPGATATLRSHIRRLRQGLGLGTGVLLTARAPGYLIRVQQQELDVLQFEALCRETAVARRGARWAEVSTAAAHALGLWRGTPLLDVPSEMLRDQAVPRLERMRLQALEDHAEAELRLHRYDRLIPELLDLTVQYPLREHFHAQLMEALARNGRQAEALDTYRQTRQTLIDQLGIEPGPELQSLQRKILAGDPALSAPISLQNGTPTSLAAIRNPAAAVVPRQLPAAVRHFTGRDAALAELTALLDAARTTGAGMVVAVIDGPPGVGKTALAVRWAHQVAGMFPDGQLYVNLRGYDPGEPLSAADALTGFLRSSGVPGQDIPPEQDQRAARYRSLLASKRMLVVLDNAGSADQVRPLLPGTPACAVVVTSRDALAGLVARDGATRLDLDVLPLQDAIALLRALIGPRVDAGRGAAAKLADQCCRLPLALRVAAELAASRPAVPLAALTAELADLRTRLDLLAADGDHWTEVRAVFSWSYRHLDVEDARTFRLLGLHPGPDFEPYATAALAGTTVQQARRALDVLARAHLLFRALPGRYGMHDLLRSYARELAVTLDAGEEQHAALTRLFDYYLHTAAAAMDTLYPAERHRRPRIPRLAAPVPSLAGPAGAREWLDDERAALVAAAGHTAAHGWPGHATRLAATLSRYLSSGDHVPEALTVFSHALGAARRTGDRAAEATALNDIGIADALQGRYRQAGDRHRQALALFRAVGDRVGEARVLINIGVDETELGRYEQAARHQQEALALFGDIGDRFGEARALGNLGLARQRQGRYQEAAGYHQQSLSLFREIGDHQGEAWALSRLGVIDLRLGRCQHAAGYLRHALALFQEMGNAGSEAECRIRLGEVYAGLGGYEQAAGNFEQALAVFRAIGDPVLEADALNGFGEVLFRMGEADKALAHHASALRVGSEADAPREQARAHSGLARACQTGPDSRQARHHWQEALTRYAAIGAPEASEIRARLSGADDGDGAKPAGEDGGITGSPPG